MVSLCFIKLIRMHVGPRHLVGPHCANVQSINGSVLG